MVSLNSGPNHLSFSRNLTFRPVITPFPFLGTKKSVCLNPQISHFGFARLIKKTQSLSCFCKGDGEIEKEIELEIELEEEILEFMKGRENPGAFPTKTELIEAGRRDLLDAIVRRGGWLSLGWDLEGDERENGEIGKIDEEKGIINGEKNSKINGEDNGNISEEKGIMGGVVKDFNEDIERLEEDCSRITTGFPKNPTFSGRSFEIKDDQQESGVEGILSRLEKERNFSLGANLTRQSLSKNNSDDWLLEASGDADNDHLRRSRRLSSGSSRNGIIINSGGKFTPTESLSDFDGSLEPEKGKTSTIQQAKFSSVDYDGDAPKVEIIENSSEGLDENGDNYHNDIRIRLQHLELELASTLSSLKSKKEKIIPKEGYGPITEMHNLSDALEFQETEIMNAKDTLRSLHAKLSVLEGKMTLSIIGARKTIDEKQKRIDIARKASQLLRITSIVWPNSASEVFLIGSFDGWTTQRRMKKSSGGIFSVELKLYPGKYEIKFIVDGEWKVDPLRPIVTNNGYENNLFIVT